MFCFQATTYICSKTNQLITLLAKLQRDNMFVERSGLRLQLRKKGVCWHAIFFLQFTYYEVKLWCSVWYYKDKLICMYYNILFLAYFFTPKFLTITIMAYYRNPIMSYINALFVYSFGDCIYSRVWNRRRAGNNRRAWKICQKE